ncbi:hypothetical protein HPB48_022308 [Haemaphysalis longicornis]|uniref:Uncharacterized protein n=1 Tax=Haemaphysalis longicornis TaxID=44386 RepID=A0A9J6FTA7_HAELO|nr:hypothetical protein HPB48_022308 [Haemaphysalis longicornis]
MSCDTTLTVQGLTENGEYLFRVMAVNENGMSVPLEGTNPIIAKLPFDPPSAPGIPVVTEVGGDFVNLSWEKPASDGGARILGYWVDKREVGTQAWQRVNPAHLCLPAQINIPNLIEDRQYEFRVFAVNEAGQGPPSSNSQQIKIKDPHAATPPEFTQPLKPAMGIKNKSAQFQCKVVGNPTPEVAWYKGTRELHESLKYSITREGDLCTLIISDIFGEDADEYACRAVNKGGARTSRAELLIKTPPHINVPPRFRELACFEKGENVVLKIPFTGFPKPRIKWFKESEEIESGSHFDIQTGERHAILTIRDVNKTDSGPYRLVAENELGMDSAIIKVQISDKPDPPRHPVVENINDDNCLLSWKPPLWDGGSHVTNYMIEKRESPLTTWVRCGNTRFTTHQITGLNPGKEYQFRVYAENVFGRSEPCEPTSPITTKPSKKDKKKDYMVDEHGKKIRGKSEGKISNYDQFVHDFDKYIPQPIDIKTSSVYDYYDILEEIGTGAFGVVHRCREKKTGHIFAAKFIPVSHPLEKSLIRKEIDIMNQLHHPKLIRLHDAFEDDDEMVLIYEFMSGGELFERITAEDYKMSEAEVINYMRQICEGVKHMHEKNIIHLDLKPENIMCQTKNSTNVKLIDFGLATKLDPNEVVKISTGTAEFAAPEIVDREPVGFYTDMWAVGVLAYVLWQKLISRTQYTFVCLSFHRKRMTAHECLEHDWLKGDIKESATIPIPNSRYIKFRDHIRAKYGHYWDSCLVPIGHIANYSSLRKLHDKKYNIHDFYFDRRQAAPRFVIKPTSAFAYEGQSAKFYCRVIAAAPATITWYRDSCELRQSVKHMKRYEGDDYYFILNRCRLDDRGEYIIRAENSYGYREEPVFLNVQAMPITIPEVRLEEPIRRRREPLRYQPYEEPADTAPCFTFHLRPRVIQTNLGVKLLACLSGKPHPEIKWYKDGKELSKFDYNMAHADGVVTLEILTCKKEDAGKYVCKAKNALGEDESSCFLIVEDRRKLPAGQSPTVIHHHTGAAPASPTPYSTTKPAHSGYYDSSLPSYARASGLLGLHHSGRGDYSHTSSKFADSRSFKSSGLSTDYSSAAYSAKDYSSASRHLASSDYKDSAKDRVASTLSSAASKLSPPLDSATPKRVQKPYGKKEGAEGTSPSRSRTATQELKLNLKMNLAGQTSFACGFGSAFFNGKQRFRVRVTRFARPQFVLMCFPCKHLQPLKSSDIVSLKYKNREASLSIGEVYPEDEGEYVLVATNAEGKAETRSKLTVLRKKRRRKSRGFDGKSPKFAEHLKSHVVKTGDAVTLQCTIRGSSKFDVVWLHNEKEIKSSKDFQYVTEGEVYKLVIAEIFPEDSGTYTCEAFNDVGEAFSTCTLDVLANTWPCASLSWQFQGEPLVGPGFSIYPRSTTSGEGQPAAFKCVTDKEALGVRWQKDGQTLEESAHYKLGQEGRTFTLTIPQATVTDVGQYVVIANDASGESTASFALNVVSEADQL